MEPRNKLQEYHSIFAKIPDFIKLTPQELFLLGYSIGKHEGKFPPQIVAEQLIKSHNLAEQNLLKSLQKDMIEYLLFEGTYEGIDAILDAFSKPNSQSKPKNSLIKKPNSPVPISDPKKPSDSFKPQKLARPPDTSQDEILAELEKTAKRSKMIIDSNDSQKDIEFIEIDKNKTSPKSSLKIDNLDKKYPEDEKQEKIDPTQVIISSSLEEKLNMELIKKLEEEDKKQVELSRKLKEDENLEKAVCMICFDKIDPTQYNPLEPCGHLFHAPCFKAYVDNKISSREFPIFCPILECKAEIDGSFIKEIIESSEFEKFDQYSFKFLVERNSEEYSCCPTPDCSYVFVWVAKEDSNDFTCPKCKKRYCLNCRVAYHTGMTCKEYEINNKHTSDDDKFLKFVKGKKYKQCPKCKFWVSKTQGCNHMTCRCKFQFCYACGGEYMKCDCVKALQARQEAKKGGKKRK